MSEPTFDELAFSKSSNAECRMPNQVRNYEMKNDRLQGVSSVRTSSRACQFFQAMLGSPSYHRLPAPPLYSAAFSTDLGKSEASIS